MPIDSEIKVTKNSAGKDIRTFEITFTNGAISQLEELREFFGKETLLDVVGLGISLLQGFKEEKETSSKREPNADKNGTK